MPFLKSECNILYALSFRPKKAAALSEAEGDAKHHEVEESISIASPKANQKVKLIYSKRH